MIRTLGLRVACAVGVLGAAPARSAPAVAQGTAPGSWSGFVARLDAFAESTGVVGAAAVFLRDGRIVARHQYGVMERGARRPVTERTLFHWASITKTLTAVAIMQLRDRGRLDLDDPVTRWIPELRAVHNPFGSMDAVTVRMLLTHSAGFQGATWPWDEGDSWEPFEPTDWAQLVAMMPYQRLRFAPGSRYAYSNPGYIYLGRIIELVTGDPWESYVQKNIFAPLGMTRSYFRATPYYLQADRSHGYELRGDSAGSTGSLFDYGADFDPGVTVPNSGWNAPLDDVAAFAAFLTGGTRDRALRERQDSVLSRSTLREMWSPQLSIARDSAAGSRYDMGLGFMLARDGATLDVEHTGDQAGYKSYLRLRAERRTAYILVFNTTGREAPRLFDALRRSAVALLGE